MQSGARAPEEADLHERDQPIPVEHGRTADAVTAYTDAIDLVTDDTERTFLETQRARLTGDT